MQVDRSPLARLQPRKPSPHLHQVLQGLRASSTDGQTAGEWGGTQMRDVTIYSLMNPACPLPLETDYICHAEQALSSMASCSLAHSLAHLEPRGGSRLGLLAKASTILSPAFLKDHHSYLSFYEVSSSMPSIQSARQHNWFGGSAFELETQDILIYVKPDFID